MLAMKYLLGYNWVSLLFYSGIYAICICLVLNSSHKDTSNWRRIDVLCMILLLSVLYLVVLFKHIINSPYADFAFASEPYCKHCTTTVFYGNFCPSCGASFVDSCVVSYHGSIKYLSEHFKSWYVFNNARWRCNVSFTLAILVVSICNYMICRYIIDRRAGKE